MTGEPGADMVPRWSPDGSLVAYVRYPPGSEGATFWLIDIQNGVRRAASKQSVQEWYGDLLWSPDSRYLVYTAAQPDGLERDVYRLNVQSGEIVNLTANSPVWDSDPAWSPDGKWIAFVSDRAEGGKDVDNVWLMKPDGTEPRNVTDSDWEDVNPAWSPDGTQIVFYRWAFFGSEDRGPGGLWVTDLEGKEERLLVELDMMAVQIDAPAWSPDGRLVAYQSGAPGAWDIYVLPVGGGSPIKLSGPAGNDSDIRWAPDSRSLIYTHATEDDLRLYIAAADGTNTRPLLGVGGNGFGDWAPASP